MKTTSTDNRSLESPRERRPARLDPVCLLKAEFFRCLGHPIRISLLTALSDAERSVGELRTLAAVESSGASQHLAALRRQGLVVRRKAGTTVYYRVSDHRIANMLALAGRLSAPAPSCDDAPSTPLLPPREGRVA